MTITEFLTARYDSAESLWSKAARHELVLRVGNGPEVIAAGGFPAEMLADIAAKRRIVGIHTPNPRRSVRGPFCEVCDTAGGRYPCDTLCALAQPYADHPEFNPAWRVA